MFWASFTVWTGLVVEGEGSDELAVFVQDADVEVVCQHEDGFAGVLASEAEAMQFAVVAEGVAASGVDAVTAHPEVALAYGFA